MERLADMWQRMPDELRQFIAGDIPSWLAVGIAVAAVIFALRPRSYAEFNNFAVVIGTDGVIVLSADLMTASHSPLLSAIANLKIDGVSILVELQPLKVPENFAYRLINTWALTFMGEYHWRLIMPKEAKVDIRARFSDGSSAKIRGIIQIATIVDGEA